MDTTVKPEAPAAEVRTRVTVPLEFPDGYATTAEVFTFTGLVAGREHLALAPGEWRPALAGGDAPLVRPRVSHR